MQPLGTGWGVDRHGDPVCSEKSERAQPLPRLLLVTPETRSLVTHGHPCQAREHYPKVYTWGFVSFVSGEANQVRNRLHFRWISFVLNSAYSLYIANRSREVMNKLLFLMKESSALYL